MSSVEAVTFYGYDLGSVDQSFGWEADSVKDQEPEWIEEGEIHGEDYAVAMSLAVLRAAGVDHGNARRGALYITDLDNHLARNCGVQFLPYGHQNTQFYGIALAGTVQTADDWSPKRVRLELPGQGLDWPHQEVLDSSAKLLHDALKALGLKPAVGGPSWIISARE